MQNLGVLMEFAPYAVAAVFAHNGKALLFGMLLDDMADVAQGGAGANLLYAQPHALIGGFGEPPGQNGRFAYVIHTDGFAEPAVFDDGNVRSEERRVGEAGVSQCRSRGLP